MGHRPCRPAQRRQAPQRHCLRLRIQAFGCSGAAGGCRQAFLGPLSFMWPVQLSLRVLLRGGHHCVGPPFRLHGFARNGSDASWEILIGPEGMYNVRCLERSGVSRGLLVRGSGRDLHPAGRPKRLEHRKLRNGYHLNKCMTCALARKLVQH